MLRHWNYLIYLLRHKWCVLLVCWSRGLIWRGLVHDLSKFRLSEWIPYARHFYNPDGSRRNGARGPTGYYKPTDTGDAAFDFAWLLHQKRNRHHWQWWILPEDEGGVKVLDMPNDDIREMVYDWMGASMAQGKGRDVRPWYEKNKSKMTLSPVTRELVEWLITRPGKTTTGSRAVGDPRP